jgi:hypothetical protein
MIRCATAWSIALLLTGGAIAGIYWAAPRVSLFEVRRPAPALDRFQLRVWLNHQGMSLAPGASLAAALASRPGDVRDLIKRGEERLPLPAAMAAADVAKPHLAGDPSERVYDLNPDAALIKALDAKQRSLERDAFTSGIRVAQRLVRPSQDRLLEQDAKPVLRSALQSDNAPPLPIDSASLSSNESVAAVSSTPPVEPALPRPAAPASLLTPEAEARLVGP